MTVISPAPARQADPLTLSGELRPLVDAPIYARASGYVRKWYVDIGAHVTEGQVLAELDTPEMDRELLEGRAELKQAEANSEMAQTTAKRWAQMLTNRTVSAQEADEKQSDLSNKRAAVEAARAKVSRLEELTNFSKITAPFAGTVTVRRLDVGQLVNAVNGQELFRISQMEKLRVFVRVPQSYARAVQVDQKAELTLPELPGRTFTGKIVRTAGAIDIASRTLLTELEVENPKGELLSGSYAQVRLLESLPQAALTVPSNCLLFRAEGPQVGLVGADHRVALRKVRVGRDLGTHVEILEGVAQGDRLIVNPPDALVDGAEVRVDEQK
jgi:RND family efflux transporter MFP subunit